MHAAKRRFLDVGPTTPTFIGADTEIFGNVRGPGPFVVAGTVHGDGELGTSFNLAVNGAWHGNVRAQRAVIAGTVIGSLAIEDKLEIGYSAVIRGRVSARSIAIAKGAVIDGEIEVTSGAAIVQFEEKRETD